MAIVTEPFRLVTFTPGGRVQVLYDFNDGASTCRLDGTFQFTPAARQLRWSQDPSAYGGQLLAGAGGHDNATLAATIAVRASGHNTAAGLIEDLLAWADARAHVSGLWIEWRPMMLPWATYSPVRGPATVQPAYNTRAWTFASYATFAVSWPVAPLLEGAPMNVTDDFQDGTLDEWTLDDNSGAARAFVDVPTGAPGLGLEASTAGMVSMRHTSRGYDLHDMMQTATLRTPRTYAQAFTALLGKKVGDAVLYGRLVIGTAGGGTLTIGVRTPTSDVTLATATISSVPAAAIAWLRIVVNAGLPSVEYWPPGLQPSLARTVTGLVRITAPASTTLTPFAGGGEPVVEFDPRAADARLVSVAIDPYALGMSDSGGQTVATAPLRGLPGTAPARVDVDVHYSSTTAAPWGLVSTWLAPRPYNRLSNGEPRSTTGWTAGSVAGEVATGANLAFSATGGPPPGGEGYIAVTASGVNQGATTLSGEFDVEPQQLVTVRAWVDMRSGTWQAGLFTDNAAANIIQLGAWQPITGAGWQEVVVQARATINHRGFEVAFRETTGVAGRELRVAQTSVVTGDLPATSIAQTGGRGARPPVGALDMNNAVATSNVTLLAFQPNTLRRYASLVAGQTNGSVDFLLDAGLITPDPGPMEDMRVEVFALAYLDPARQDARAAVSVVPFGLPAARVYAHEWGTAGRPLTPPTGVAAPRPTRLGTVTLPTLVAGGRVQLRVDMLGGTGSGAFQLWYLFLTPVQSRASTPTGKPNDASYPTFLPAGVANQALIKRVQSHGDAILMRADTGESGWESGISGAPITVGPGDSQLAVWAGTMVPDEPVLTGATYQDLTVGVAPRVTPRYRLMRPGASGA